MSKSVSAPWGIELGTVGLKSNALPVRPFVHSCHLSTKCPSIPNFSIKNLDFFSHLVHTFYELMESKLSNADSKEFVLAVRRK